jgi:hypothetical protein
LAIRSAAKCQNAIDSAVSYVPTLESDLTTVLMKLDPLLNRTGSKVILAAYQHFGLNIPFVLRDIFRGRSVETTNQLRFLSLAVEAAQARAVQTANEATKAIFDGHEAHPSAFRRNSEGWIWELAPPSPIEICHMNPKGYAMLARGVFDAYFANSSFIPVAAPVPAPRKRIL